MQNVQEFVGGVTALGAPLSPGRAIFSVIATRVEALDTECLARHASKKKSNESVANTRLFFEMLDRVSNEFWNGGRV